jgi:hypothetical protein
MPRKTARPRARPRRLEGIERLNALVTVGVMPALWGDEEQQRRDLRQLCEMWLELRDEAIATGDDLDEHWWLPGAGARRGTADHRRRALGLPV